MSMEPFLSFLAVAGLALLVPGPDTFVVLRTALADGRRAGTSAAAGAAAGQVLWGAASVLGLAAALAASPTAGTALELAGAAYLAYLGTQALAAARRGDALAGPAGGTDGGRGAWRRGLASDLTNVKVGLFWTALLPQFLQPGAGPLLPAAMVVSMAALVFGGLSAYAALGARLAGVLARPRASRAVNGVVGVALVGVAVLMATH
jgi:threonine/homoserine/homoserine lactone efflux protein